MFDPRAYSDFDVIDKICDQLSPEAATVVLELAQGMTASGWDESGAVMRAQTRLERRLGQGAKTVVVEGSGKFKQLIAECADKSNTEATAPVSHRTR